MDQQDSRAPAAQALVCKAEIVEAKPDAKPGRCEIVVSFPAGNPQQPTITAPLGACGDSAEIAMAAVVTAFLRTLSPTPK